MGETPITVTAAALSPVVAPGLGSAQQLVGPASLGEASAERLLIAGAKTGADAVPIWFVQVSAVSGADIKLPSAVLLNGYKYQTDVTLAVGTELTIDCDDRDWARKRRMVYYHFDGLGWKTPAVLAQGDTDDEFDFDRLNQFRMPVCSNGQVAQVGEAGYGVSPVAGMRGSMAIIGAAG